MLLVQLFLVLLMFLLCFYQNHAHEYEEDPVEHC